MLLGVIGISLSLVSCWSIFAILTKYLRINFNKGLNKLFGWLDARKTLG